VSKLLESGQMINTTFNNLNIAPIRRATAEELIKYNTQDYEVAMNNYHHTGEYFYIRCAVISLERTIGLMKTRIKNKHCE